MRILFSMRHPGALRNFASTLQALAERNHQVHLVFGQQDKEGDDRLLDEAHPRLPQHHRRRDREEDPVALLARSRPRRALQRRLRPLPHAGVRQHQQPQGAGERQGTAADALARRAADLPQPRRKPISHQRAAGRRARRSRSTARVFELVERERPDVLLVTPLVDIGSDQVDYVKAARRLGVRSALPVLSWDNLTNKGLIRVQPDEVFVWNEAQKTEAVGDARDRSRTDVIVTGAMVYDQWFARRPSSTREEFCARVGLDPAKPILLYLCSSPFIAPDEVNLHRAVDRGDPRAPDPRVRTAGLLIRPHPENLQPWHRFDEMALENVAVWPRGGASPVDRDSRNDFFDSMYHAAGAVGINTSAQIECGIVGRPVFSIRTPAYQRTQEGTLHFRHLTTEGGGLLHLADDFETHVRQIAERARRSGRHAAADRRVRQGVHASARPGCRGHAAHGRGDRAAGRGAGAGAASGCRSTSTRCGVAALSRSRC